MPTKNDDNGPGETNSDMDGTLDEVILLERDEEAFAAGAGGRKPQTEQSWLARNKILVVLAVLLVIIAGAVGGALAATRGEQAPSGSSGSAAADGSSDVQFIPMPSPAPPPCVSCTNLRSPFMVANDLYCDTYSRIFTRRCANEGSWWIEAPEPYCQYSCWENGVGYADFPCCPIDDLSSYEPPAVEKEPGCIECTNTRTQLMIDNLQTCDSDEVLDTQCNNPGSEWNTLDDPPCQYECWRWSRPYDEFQNCCKWDPEPFFGLEFRAPNAAA